VPPRQVSQQGLGFFRIVQLIGLSQHLLDARVQVVRHALDDIAALVDRTTPDGGDHAIVVRSLLDSAFVPSTMNSWGKFGSSPLPSRLLSSDWPTAVFSIAPLATARMCLLPSQSTPITASRTWSPPWKSSICTTNRSSSERSESRNARIFLRDSAMKRLDTADFEVPSALIPCRSLSGTFQLAEVAVLIYLFRKILWQIAVLRPLPPAPL